MTCIDPARLQRAMETTGVGTKELADRTGTSISYMARIVKGDARLKRNPALRRSIATALDVPLDWITLEKTAAA